MMTLSREIGDMDSMNERNGHLRCLACKPLAAATIAKRVNVAKCIFSRARRWKLVPENPFEHRRARPRSTPDRAVCVRHEVVQRIIDQCPRPQWRANAHFEVAIRDDQGHAPRGRGRGAGSPHPGNGLNARRFRYR